MADAENSKGRTMADKIIKELRDADLLHKTYGAIVFDTTSSNTGVFKGAATYLEIDLDSKLLWLACRHHIFELILVAAWTATFGSSKSKDNLEFKKFQGTWNTIDRTAPISRLPTGIYSKKCMVDHRTQTVECLQKVLTVNNAAILPRNDYR